MFFFLAVNLKSIYNEFSFKQTAACRINSQRQLKNTRCTAVVLSWVLASQE